jgi:hypothetical protein
MHAEAEVVRVMNVHVPFAHALVQGRIMASGTGMMVVNRSSRMHKTVPPGSWIIIRSTRLMGSVHDSGPCLQALHDAWAGMPEDLSASAYTGAIRYKDCRPLSSLASCAHCTGPYCWLFDDWYAFARLYNAPDHVHVHSHLFAVPAEHTVLLPTKYGTSKNSTRTKRRRQHRTSAGGNDTSATQVSSINPDRGKGRQASGHQVLRNGAIQLRDHKLGSRSVPAITMEFDRRVMSGRNLGLDPVCKSTVCNHRRQMDIANLMLERELLQAVLSQPNSTLTITSDNTPDPRGHELNGQVYTLVSCNKLDDLGPDGYPIPVEDCIKIFPPVTRVPSGKRGYDSMVAMVKILRLYGATTEDLLSGAIEFSPKPVFDPEGVLLLQPLSQEEQDKTPLLAQCRDVVGDAGGEIHKGHGSIEFLKGDAKSMDFWHCLLHVLNLHCKKGGSELTTRAGKLLRTVAMFVRDSNYWTELSHRMKVLLGREPLPSAGAVKGEREKAVAARQQLAVEAHGSDEPFGNLDLRMGITASDLDCRFPVGTDIRWQYDLHVNRYGSPF